ncbi:TPA: hypothetical protein NHR53_006395 [Pseudomonas aeruginosa]|uniref:hypothetical protein n=1 Tax=Pseudomonas aeruginosa TaxID=287 RepID=UPI000802BCB5|nr:hypothetical protein [Pseudomonas aeruginosa]MBW6123681.1 hypothetical protein [Pseudomonas aeruginosa]OBY20804.1 hypothetical protein A8O37_25790 [Pseudomonas aeruginosa]HCE7248477.1 hypothetical protein [Pseudomonas aeruginosa]HCE8129792.1 hypothetical protein [Pseudomonas aeruginosa]HCF0447921.1 hypothetical protein [Pseudomonas aeruginosa]
MNAEQRKAAIANRVRRARNHNHQAILYRANGDRKNAGQFVGKRDGYMAIARALKAETWHQP